MAGVKPVTRAVFDAHAPVARDAMHNSTVAGRGALLAVVAAFTVVTIGGTLPTPMYSQYADSMALDPLSVTLLFAVYVGGVVMALLVAPVAAASLGGKGLTLAALAIAAASSCLFVRADSVAWLMSARLLSGISVGLIANSATTLLLELESARPSRASGMAITANAGGLATGALAAGLAVENLPGPTTTTYVVHLALVGITTLGLHAIRRIEQRQVAPSGRITPRCPREIRKDFPAALAAAGMGFAFTGVFTAASGLLVRNSLGHDNAIMAGLPTFLAFGGMVIGQICVRDLNVQRSGARSALACICAAGLFVVALRYEAPLWLLTSAAMVGIPTGAGLKVGLTATVGKSQVADRPSVTSLYFVCLYSLLALPALILGVLAAHIGLTSAGSILAYALGGLSVVALLRFVRRAS